jgi:quercetin dioxygenase-like cupin family protein
MDWADQYCVLSATMPPGTGVPLHQHPQQEAFFILEGQAEFAVENGAGLTWKKVNPGDVVNIPPDAIHGFRKERPYRSNRSAGSFDCDL